MRNTFIAGSVLQFKFSTSVSAASNDDNPSNGDFTSIVDSSSDTSSGFDGLMVLMKIS